MIEELKPKKSETELAFKALIAAVALTPAAEEVLFDYQFARDKCGDGERSEVARYFIAQREKRIIKDAEAKLERNANADYKLANWSLEKGAH